jgi:hypothetical protein
MSAKARLAEADVGQVVRRQDHWSNGAAVVEANFPNPDSAEV